MFKRLASRPILLAAVAVALFAAGWVLVQDVAFRWAAKPPGAFARERAPAPPDYAQASSWALRPAAPPPGAWETPWGVDVFFIHPTSAYAGDTWNAAIDDAAAAGRLDQVILPNHAAPFQHAGPVYAPRYRQAALHSEMNVGGEGDAAFALAYDDVLRAFDHYIANDNNGRAVVLAGVGQGGLHALRLLRDRFQDDSLKQRLAAAYIVDAATPANLSDLGVSQPVCASHAATQCLVAWRRPLTSGERSPVWSADGEIEPLLNRPTVCVNPLLWTSTSDLAPAADHRGAARAHLTGETTSGGPEPDIEANAVSTRCVDGLLDVDGPALASYRPKGWGARYKTPEFNLFYADIAYNASERARAISVWLDENARKPAKPLPPALILTDAPIHRPDGVADPVR